MLKDLFPRGHRRYTSLPVLGSMLDGFGQFLSELGYPRMCVRIHVRTAWHVDARLQRCSCRSVAQITRANLRACAPSLGRSQYNAHVSATVRLLERYFDKRAILSPPEPPSPIGRMLSDYVLICSRSVVSHREQSGSINLRRRSSSCTSVIGVGFRACRG